jgi:hypothetical protein
MYSINSRRITFYKEPNSYNHNIFVLVRDGNENGFTVNGNSGILTANDFTTVPNMAGWKYTRKNISTTVPSGTVVINNNSGAFSLGYFYTGAAAGASASFGYLSQFGSLKFSDTTYMCNGFPVVLDAGYALSYNWTLPNGSHLTTPIIIAIDTGLYSVVVDQDPFLITTSTRVLNRFEGSALISFPENNVGAGTYTYTANPGLYPPNHVVYTWFVDGVPVSNEPSFTVTWNTGDENTITLQLRDTVMDCTKVHTLVHYPNIALFYVNDVYYENLSDTVFCNKNVYFQAEIEGELHEDPGRIKWLINGVEYETVRDLLQWNKPFETGIYLLEMQVRFKNGEIISITSTLEMQVFWIKIKNIKY